MWNVLRAGLRASSGLAARMYTVHSCDLDSSAVVPRQKAHEPYTIGREA
jgi:hypothetical protein